MVMVGGKLELVSRYSFITCVFKFSKVNFAER